MSKTKERPSINNTPTRTKLVREYVAAQAALSAAEDAAKRARELLLKSIGEDEGILVTDAGSIAVDVAERPSYDIDVLAKVLDEETFASVTKVAVDSAAFNAAKKRNELPAAVSKAITLKSVVVVKVVK
jgi:hypothetical protein